MNDAQNVRVDRMLGQTQVAEKITTNRIYKKNDTTISQPV